MTESRVDCASAGPLLMGLIDKELTEQEAVMINEHLVRCAACRKDYDELAAAAKTLDAVSFAEPGDEVLKSLWRSPLERAERVGGLVLLVGGYLTLAAYGLYEFVTSPDEPIVPRVALAALVIGGLLLFVSVLRERLRRLEKDPYKEVER